MDTNSYFISVDWGTSNFRLRIVEYDTLRIVEEISSPGDGILDVYQRWKAAGGDREVFFLDLLHSQVRRVKTFLPMPVKIVISGMASSSIGLRELPYATLPFTADGNNIVAHSITSLHHPGYDILLISGVRTGQDVIRGEETQLIGCLSDEAAGAGARIFIFPGTHSKHFLVRGDTVLDFSTYMTGEFFHLLSTKSVLSDSVDAEPASQGPARIESFKKGVRDSLHANLLHASFRVRTHTLFGTMDKSNNYSYLSGLLIGAELQHLQTADAPHIILVCGAGLHDLYRHALEDLGLREKTTFLPAVSSEEAVIKGQYKLLKLVAPYAE